MPSPLGSPWARALLAKQVGSHAWQAWRPLVLATALAWRPTLNLHFEQCKDKPQASSLITAILNAPEIAGLAGLGWARPGCLSAALRTIPKGRAAHQAPSHLACALGQARIRDVGVRQGPALQAGVLMNSVRWQCHQDADGQCAAAGGLKCGGGCGGGGAGRGAAAHGPRAVALGGHQATAQAGRRPPGRDRLTHRPIRRRTSIGGTTMYITDLQLSQVCRLHEFVLAQCQGHRIRPP